MPVMMSCLFKSDVTQKPATLVNALRNRFEYDLVPHVFVWNVSKIKTGRLLDPTYIYTAVLHDMHACHRHV